MSAATVSVQQATIRQYAKRLQLATIAGQFVAMADQAIKEKQSHLNYLEVMLGMEVEERERNTVARRIKEAHFPKVKTLEEFAFSDAPHLPFLGKPGRAKPTWPPDWRWQRAGRGSGCVSPPRPRW
jgi:DNA replication protein DnaC